MTNHSELESLWNKAEGGFRGEMLARVGQRATINPYHTKFSELPDEVRTAITTSYGTFKQYLNDLCAALTKDESAQNQSWIFEIDLMNSCLGVTLRQQVGIRSLHLSFGSYGHKGRIVVSGNYPRNASGQYVEIPYEVRELTREITAAESKTAVQLASDIMRRLLPSYDRILAAVAAKAKQQDDYSTAVKSNLTVLSKAFGAKLNPHGDTETFSIGTAKTNYYGDVRVSSNSCEIKLRSLSIETALKIAALLREK